MENKIFEHIWKVRTHPFRPTVDQQGNAILSNLLQLPLNPDKEESLLDYYYDFYDWKKSRPLRDISQPAVLDQFPERGPFLILIWGEGKSGRSSLRNLILFKIKKQAQQNLISVSTILEGKDPLSNLRSLARLFIDEYVNAVKEESIEKLKKMEEGLKKSFREESKEKLKEIKEGLKEIYDEEILEAREDADKPYATLFKRFDTAIRRESERPIVFVLTGGDHYGNWETIYESTRQLTDYIIVETSKEKDADAVYSSMKGRRNVVLIKACRLGIEHATKYLRERLTSERLPSFAQEPLWPFTEEALQVLFELGRNAQAEEHIDHPIGWLRKTFQQALDEHMEDLKKSLTQAGNGDVAGLPEEIRIINAERIEATRTKMNKGE